MYIEGKDWDGLVFMVTMPANEREATFSINITDDFILELRENFTIELNEPTTANVQRGDPYEAIITIIDDDRKLTNLCNACHAMKPFITTIL